MTLFAVIVSAFLFVRKFAGMIKEILLSHFFGASAATDIFKAIYNGIIYNLYSDAEQLLRPTYLPEFVKQREADEPLAWRLTGTITGLTMAAVGLVCVALMVFARPLLWAIWPDMAANPQTLELGVLLLWIMAPALFIYTLSLIPELTLHAYKRFSLAAFAEASYNVLVMAVIFVGVEFVWHPDHPHAILAAGYGVLVGGIARLGIMLPGLWSKLGQVRLSLNVRGTPGVTAMLALMPAVVMGLSVSMARPIVDARVCARLGEGMYTALDYGRRLSDAGIMILPLAISLVVFPYVSEWAVAGDRRRLSRSLLGMTRALAFLFVPLSVGLILLARPLCDLIYNHGEFKAASLPQVSLALMCYASGLFAYSVEGSINKWYFAMKDTWTPNWVGTIWALVHLTMSVVGGLYTPLGLAAVALAYPVSKTGKVITLYYLLRPRLERVPASEVWPFVVKLLVASAVMGAVVWGVGGYVAPALQAQTHGKWRLMGLLVSTGGAGAVVFLIAAALLRIEEVGQVWRWLAGKVRRRLGR
jgi:putative peptidoglycan lipid II flippase